MMYLYVIIDGSLKDWQRLNANNCGEFNDQFALSSAVKAVNVLLAKGIELNLDTFLESWFMNMPFSHEKIICLRDGPYSKGYIVSPIRLMNDNLKELL